ncbi:MAG TPA: Fe(3+) ABC transporter substrate-binding protein, partial [Gammaproteobacteria bacterium]|nr:Fe(3+) ABC transporter substrate-binding protein [Gammaproteobacteria bacterium]
PADVFITVDAGRLHRAKVGGVLQAIDSDTLNRAIPENLRDPEGHWYSLSQRARPIFYAKARFDAGTLNRYEQLAEPDLGQRLCLRGSSAVYNQSLVASMIVARGAEATEAWIRGIVANQARKPVGGDTEQLLALAAGECDLTFVNTYYFGRMLASDDPQVREAADKIGVIWPNQADRGTHVNVSAAGVTASARNRDNAIRLLEFLVEPEAQVWYAEVNNEYPVVPGTQVAERMQALGDFKADAVNLKLLGDYNLDAVTLMDRAGWR